MNDDKSLLQIANRAIEDDRIDEARSLLQPLMKRKVPESYILASRVADSQEQALKFLKYALKLDPDNIRIQASVKELEEIFLGLNKSVHLSELVTEPTMKQSTRIKETVAVFEKFGWEVVGQRDGYAQFIRRKPIIPLLAFGLGFMFNIFSLVVLIFYFIRAENEHAFVESTGSHLILNHETEEIEIYYPEQAVIYLDRQRSISVVAVILYNILGISVSTLAIVAFFLYFLSQ